MSGMRKTVVDSISARFAYSANKGENKSIANDLENGWNEVPEELKEAVDYPRVPFNYPKRSLPQANWSALQTMAFDALEEAGHLQERTQLMRVFHWIKLKYGDIPALLHRFLDFSPTSEPGSVDPEGVRELAKKLGVDASQIKVEKKNNKNPLARHKKTMSAKEEWAWLVKKKDVVSPYGKDAAQELSRGMIGFLAGRWLDELRVGKKSDAPKEGAAPEDFSRAWFAKEFPMGWMNLDVFHDTAIVSRNFGFEEQMKVMLWEESQRVPSGWPVEDARRIAWRHKNEAGISGEALLAVKAWDFFEKTLAPILETGQAQAGAGEENALTRWLEFQNPGIGKKPKEVWAWLCFAQMAPDIASQVEKGFLEDMEKKKKAAGAQGQGNDKAHQAGSLLARLEEMHLMAISGVKLWGDAPSARQGLADKAVEALSKLRL